MLNCDRGAGWRRSHRPSIRDISIIDEEETAEERDAEASEHSPPATPVAPAALSPPATITVQPNRHT
jgi:hypothetical protein